MSSKANMQIVQCNQVMMPPNQQGKACAVYSRRVASIYAAHQLRLSQDHWDRQGKYQYIELAHAIIQQHGNLEHLKKSQRIVFIYISPEFHASTHLGPAIQHHYQLASHCIDIIDCHCHALPYALLISLHQPLHHHHMAIIYLEQAINHTFSATPYQTTNNSAGILCVSNKSTGMMPYSYEIAAVYLGKNLNQITQKQPHLNRLNGIVVITNHTTIETNLQAKANINKVHICLSAGFSTLFLYLQQFLKKQPPCEHIWIILHSFIDHSTSFIWIKKC